MTTPHIGDEDELVTADRPNPAENPDQPEPAENPQPPDPAENLVQPEPAEIPRVMDGRCLHPPPSTSMQQICTVNGNTGLARLKFMPLPPI